MRNIHLDKINQKINIVTVFLGITNDVDVDVLIMRTKPQVVRNGNVEEVMSIDYHNLEIILDTFNNPKVEYFIDTTTDIENLNMAVNSFFVYSITSEFSVLLA